MEMLSIGSLQHFMVIVLRKQSDLQLTKKNNLQSVFKSVLRSPTQRYIRNEFFSVSRETFLRWGDKSLVHLATGQYLPSGSIRVLKKCSISVKQAD